MHKPLIAATFIWAVIIAFFSLIFSMPAEGGNPSYIMHFTAYTVLACLGLNIRTEKRAFLLITCLAIGYGVLIEFLQIFAGRTCSAVDAFVNAIGILTATTTVYYAGKLAEQ